jgi:hypothetical protein
MNTNRDLEMLSSTAKDVLYVGVGMGILGFQKLQVRRRELAKASGGRYSGPATLIDHTIEAVELQLDRVIDEVEALLPARAGAAVAQAHGVARSTRNHLRSLVFNAS